VCVAALKDIGLPRRTSRRVASFLRVEAHEDPDDDDDDEQEEPTLEP
jgi:hypothetical protein